MDYYTWSHLYDNHLHPCFVIELSCPFYAYILTHWGPHKGPVVRKCFHFITLPCINLDICVLVYIYMCVGTTRQTTWIFICNFIARIGSKRKRRFNKMKYHKNHEIWWNIFKHASESLIYCIDHEYLIVSASCNDNWLYPSIPEKTLQDLVIIFTRHFERWVVITWWRHQMETFSALLALCAGNSPVPGEFPTQRPVTRSFDVSFDLRLNKRLSQQTLGWWFETPSSPL